MIMRRSYIVCSLLVLAVISHQPFKLEASPIKEVKNTRHDLIVPMSVEHDTCTVCHTDRIPWQLTPDGKKVLNSENRPDTPTSPPLWDTGRSVALSSYPVMHVLPLSEHPYNHPTGSSFVCLSCHDGALGTDMHGINVGEPRVAAAANLPFVGMSTPLGSPPLSRVDHPISIPYPRKSNGVFVPLNPTVTRSRYWALPDRHEDGITLPTTATSAYLDLPEGKHSTPEQRSTLIRTTEGMLECDSCHNPHREEIRPFLRVPSATLCLVCHDR